MQDAVSAPPLPPDQASRLERGDARVRDTARAIRRAACLEARVLPEPDCPRAMVAGQGHKRFRAPPLHGSFFRARRSWTDRGTFLKLSRLMVACAHRSGARAKDISIQGDAMHPIVRRQTIGDLLRRTAQRLPHKLAVAIAATAPLGYARFDALVTRLAAGLAESAASACGDRVAILCATVTQRRHALCALAARLGRGADRRSTSCSRPAEWPPSLRHSRRPTAENHHDSLVTSPNWRAPPPRWYARLRDFVWLPSEDQLDPAPAWPALTNWRPAPTRCRHAAGQHRPPAQIVTPAAPGPAQRAPC